MQYPKSADSASKPSSAKGRKDGRHKKRRKGSDQREIERRGIQIADNEGQTKRLYKKRWEVAAQSVSGKRYEVVSQRTGFTAGASTMKREAGAAVSIVF